MSRYVSSPVSPSSSLCHNRQISSHPCLDPGPLVVHIYVSSLPNSHSGNWPASHECNPQVLLLFHCSEEKENRKKIMFFFHIIQVSGNILSLEGTITQNIFQSGWPYLSPHPSNPCNYTMSLYTSLYTCKFRISAKCANSAWSVCSLAGHFKLSFACNLFLYFSFSINLT